MKRKVYFVFERYYNNCKKMIFFQKIHFCLVSDDLSHDFQLKLYQLVITYAYYIIRVDVCHIFVSTIVLQALSCPHGNFRRPPYDASMHF
jgi:hypothetical protein